VKNLEKSGCPEKICRPGTNNSALIAIAKAPPANNATIEAIIYNNPISV
jgi:hypothetical protein